jgi:hypothetical protein
VVYDKVLKGFCDKVVKKWNAFLVRLMFGASLSFLQVYGQDVFSVISMIVLSFIWGE